jgi:hypothetical protein
VRRKKNFQINAENNLIKSALLIFIASKKGWEDEYLPWNDLYEIEERSIGFKIGKAHLLMNKKNVFFRITFNIK